MELCIPDLLISLRMSLLIQLITICFLLKSRTEKTSGAQILNKGKPGVIRFGKPFFLPTHFSSRFRQQICFFLKVHLELTSA